MRKRAGKSNLNDQVIEVFDRISRCARRYGFPAIIYKLKQLEADDEETNVVSNYIFEIVTEKYNVHRKDILGSKRGIASEARKICLILLDNHTTLSANSITTVFDNRSKTVLFQVKKEFENISDNPTTRYDKKFVAIHSELNEKIVDFKKTIVIENKKINTEIP